MEKTIIGVFDHPNDVQPVIDELRAMGISESAMEVKDQEASVQTGRDSSYSLSDSETESRGSYSGFKRWLMDLGLKDDDTDTFAESVRRGGTLLVVHSEDDGNRLSLISDIMCNHGAVDIDRRGEYYRKSGFTSFDENAAPYSPDETNAERERFAAGGQFAIPVVEEDVKVSKRKVNLGGIRIVNRVIETPIDEEVQLRDEHYDVERRQVDRPVNASDIDSFKDDVMELKETREEAYVEKEARVKEEVLVHKDVDEHTEQVHDTARRTEVKVERSDDANRNPR